MSKALRKTSLATNKVASYIQIESLFILYLFYFSYSAALLPYCCGFGSVMLDHQDMDMVTDEPDLLTESIQMHAKTQSCNLDNFQGRQVRTAADRLNPI